jgi:hypothetical protein
MATSKKKAAPKAKEAKSESTPPQEQPQEETTPPQEQPQEQPQEDTGLQTPLPDQPINRSGVQPITAWNETHAAIKEKDQAQVSTFEAKEAARADARRVHNERSAHRFDTLTTP